MARREDLSAHKVDDRYELVEVLGEGGMGTVWRGQDLLLRRPVAVKQIELPPHLEGEERVALRLRVLREAQAAARVSHPHLVAIFDVVEEGGTVFLVQELVDAPTLKALVTDNGPLAPEEAAAIGVQLVDALAAAHRNGVTHRDVKPANVMVLSDGAVKLADFGIASLHGDPKLTATGVIVGSPSYMAPEHALGERAGPPADLWGVGATLYWAVEGEAPFGRGDTLATLTAVVHDPPRPTARAGRLAPTLEALLQKDPAARPSSADVATMLARVADAPAATPPGPRVTYGHHDNLRPVAPAMPVDQGPAPVSVPVGRTPAGDTVRGDATTVAAVADVDGPTRATPTGGRSPAPAGGARAAGTQRGRSRSSLAPLAAVVVALVAVAAVVGLTRDRDDQSVAGPGNQPTPTSAPAASVPVTPSTAEQPTTTTTVVASIAPTTTTVTPTSAPAVIPQLTAADAPAAWPRFTDPTTGYVIATPPGWTRQDRARIRRDFTEPGTGTYLRVEWTDTPGPSPAGAWQSLSRTLAGQKANYREIGITPTTFQGHDAALWEYTYTESGASLHAYNLGFVVGDRYGFALNMQTREERWAAAQPLWDELKAGFRPPAVTLG